jgi:hypothetical protein
VSKKGIAYFHSTLAQVERIELWVARIELWVERIERIELWVVRNNCFGKRGLER